ncbi:MAG: 4-hydroxy-3-methylbut-2-enyl diphosphate reductase [Ignavibacteriae bacterium]|nr:4-hydroxy-3-methylbut-2-enyl diphosphate reductase [Ignavibacteriota bacterium]
MREFDIPIYYKSKVISKVKNIRYEKDLRKKDYSPSVLDFGPVIFLISRHFGFCYGVENAIEISYKALEENPGKKIYLLSEMIHNPDVNKDLMSRGVSFIMDTSGKQLIPWGNLNGNDIVIIPAFGITLEIQKKLNEIGINIIKYDTTCPFVEKVWNRAAALGKAGYTIIVHGKNNHEETKATFSHSKENAPTLIVRNLEETKILGKVILNKISNEGLNELYKVFYDRYSKNFNPELHLKRIGVVNQTTMLATETEAIADYLKEVMIKKYGEANIKEHFADTRDTLCYATHDNQRATLELLEKDADIAVVVGGYNSSNTSHIVELCEEKLPTFFISSSEKIISDKIIIHYNYYKHIEQQTENYIPKKEKVKIILTSGASCPDAMVEEVMNKLLSFFKNPKSIEEVLKELS